MRSMTGYGKAERAEGGRTMTVEIKTVNNRFLDLNCKMPKNMLFLDEAVRKTVQSKVARGRVDIFFTYVNAAESDCVVTVDKKLAEGYLSAAKELEKIGVLNDLTAAAVMRLPDVLSVTGAGDDDEALKRLALGALGDAIEKLNTMRDREGASLLEDISARLNTVKSLVDSIAQRAPSVSEELMKRAKERIAELLGSSPDESRLLTEAAVLADKVSIDEEISRLYSHIGQMGTFLTEDGQGRKLDFLVQEFNREANTICSKSNDIEVTSLGLSLKSEIEKIREQVQNCE